MPTKPCPKLHILQSIKNSQDGVVTGRGRKNAAG
jgi:hypothetical protein